MNRNDKIMCFSFLSFSLRDHASKNLEKDNQLPFGTGEYHVVRFDSIDFLLPAETLLVAAIG